jgi:hypothetical protein
MKTLATTLLLLAVLTTRALAQDTINLPRYTITLEKRGGDVVTYLVISDLLKAGAKVELPLDTAQPVKYSGGIVMSAQTKQLVDSLRDFYRVIDANSRIEVVRVLNLQGRLLPAK